MQSKTVFYNLSLVQRQAWLLAALFTLGNILLPQLCHLIPNGGLIFLPIYFFTLVGAYKYGWKVGLLIAIASPLFNHLLFGMPSANALPVLLAKSSLLAIVASAVASKWNKITLPLLLLVVVSYQVVGGGIEALLTGSLAAPLQDWQLGWPGLLLQVIAGWWVIRKMPELR
ncbi:MAG: ECF transporter S component [Prevotella sp.]